MPNPSFHDAEIFSKPVAVHAARIAMTIAPHMWTEEHVEDFAVDGVLSPEQWWFTQYGGEHPLVESHNLKLALFGGPPREMVISRKHWFPEDESLAFECEIIATYEQLDDPIYAAVLTVGALTQTFGVEAEPMRIMQKGSANVGGASVGKIFIDSAGIIEDSAQARTNDSDPHSYIMRWNPFASGVPGDNVLTVLFDGVIVHETSDALNLSQPRYVALGLVQGTRINVPVTGTPGLPYFTILVDRVVTREYLGGGYESPLTPAWTTPDMGNDIDTAPDGQIYEDDGERWAKIYKDDVLNIRIVQGRDALFETFKITLSSGNPDDPYAQPALTPQATNRYYDQRWVGRTVFVDAMMTDESDPDDDNFTAWYRQICGEIDDVTFDDDAGTITLTGRGRAMGRLDSFISRSYTDINPDGNQDGEIEGTNIGYLIGEILEDLVEVSDVIAGGFLPPTEKMIQAPEVLPQMISSGGESLAPVFAELCDRLCLEVITDYDVNDQPFTKYGRIRVNLWTFENSTIMRFWARGEEYQDVIGGSTTITRRDGAGQAFYRQASPYVGDLLQSLEFLPLVGTFPSYAYPVTDRVLNDSLAEMETVGLSVLLGFPDRFGNLQAGGLAKFRYLRENAQRRRIQFSTKGTFWMFPGDGFGYSSFMLGEEDFAAYICSNIEKTWADGMWTVNVDGITQAIVTEIVRSH